MTEANTLNIELREQVGKGAARQLRRDGKVPAIIYGKQGETKISIAQRDIIVVWERGGFLSRVLQLTDGKNKFQVLPRDIQLHPVKDSPIHVDFLQIDNDTEVVVKVKVEFKNRERSPGIKMGGILNVVRHKIELRCKAGNIPELLTADLTGKKIGESVHVSAINLPEGVTPTITDRDFTIATIAGRIAKATVEAETAEEESEEESEE